MIDYPQWSGFEGRIWKDEVNVRDFIQKNYRPYDGDESFLAGPTDATNRLWAALQKLQKEERTRGGVLECETRVVSGLTAYGPGYIDESLKNLEQVVGLQTDKPLKRAFMPYGGIKMAVQAAETYGYEIDPQLKKVFTDYVTTHNDAVFAAYTPEMRLARKTHVVTGLPDTYGRGRIVGDYRRVALYGIDYLIRAKEQDKRNCGCGNMYDDVIRQREELQMQINALKGMKEMAKAYGFDISQPAANAKEACQWLYFGYLAAVKTQNGAAMSVGRISTFLDIYFERDLKNGVLTE
ncbi:MAG: formate acetyltransferase, partial [Clostridiales bacterium]|nr:formate acetyltransferase [Clostridiales bacterium]